MADGYREQAAKAFDRACRLTGLSSTELCVQLSTAMGRRSMSRQTLAAWRHGVQAVPLGAFLAAAQLAGIHPPSILALTSARFDEDSAAADLRQLRQRVREVEESGPY
jgi:hypothetical protein